MRFIFLWKLTNVDLTPNNKVLFAEPSKFDKSTKEFCWRNNFVWNFLLMQIFSLRNQNLVGLDYLGNRLEKRKVSLFRKTIWKTLKRIKIWLLPLYPTILISGSGKKPLFQSYNNNLLITKLIELIIRYKLATEIKWPYYDIANKYVKLLTNIFLNPINLSRKYYKILVINTKRLIFMSQVLWKKPISDNIG